MTTALREKTTGMKPESGTEAAPRPYHWTVDTFYRALDAGVFDKPERLELIHGRILTRMGMNPLHAVLTDLIARLLRAMMEPRFTVREEKPIHIAFDGEPIPDVSLVIGKSVDYGEHHPTPEEVILLIEVAVSSVEFDLGQKAHLYAQAGIADYWVILPETNQVCVHREPTPNGYASVTMRGMEDTVAPQIAPDAPLAVSDLLGLQDAPAQGEQT